MPSPGQREAAIDPSSVAFGDTFSRKGRRTTEALLVLGALAFAALAIAAPLAVYTVTLALFGLPHVLSELRYVDRRFSRRIGWRSLTMIVGLLAMIATARALLVLKLVPASVEVPLELGLVVLLALSVARGSAGQVSLAVGLALAIGTATALAPYDTAVSFAVLHNLTPLGFLWQLTPPGRRIAVMAPAALGLLGLPLLVATGLPRALIGGVPLANLDPIGAGALGEHLFAYVPPALAGDHAADFFTASVVAQGGHYLSVIVVLPLMLARLDPGARGVFPWPKAGWFFGLLAVAAALSLAVFSAGFAQARGFYGVFASVHAWLEIPVLILALTSLDQRTISSPTAQDAALATSETSIAR